jgi:hypothetical protein
MAFSSLLFHFHPCTKPLKFFLLEFSQTFGDKDESFQISHGGGCKTTYGFSGVLAREDIGKHLGPPKMKKKWPRNA